MAIFQGWKKQGPRNRARHPEFEWILCFGAGEENGVCAYRGAPAPIMAVPDTRSKLFAWFLQAGFFHGSTLVAARQTSHRNISGEHRHGVALIFAAGVTRTVFGLLPV